LACAAGALYEATVANATGTYASGSDQHTYRMAANGNTLRFLLDRTQIMQASDNSFLSGGDSGIFDCDVQMTVCPIRVIAL
jgi:hypothetical protein